jgi:hypothetical protein
MKTNDRSSAVFFGSANEPLNSYATGLRADAVPLNSYRVIPIDDHWTMNPDVVIDKRVTELDNRSTPIDDHRTENVEDFTNSNSDPLLSQFDLGIGTAF